MRTLACLVALAALGFGADRWRIQYFHDEDDSTLTLADLSFPTRSRGIAAGLVSESRRERPAALVTTDGGEHWEMIHPPQIALSLFFLNETVGWMVTRNGLWKTEDFGRNWKKQNSPEEVLRVWFHDANRGWAVGLRKSVHETSDGGRTWTRVAAGDAPKANLEFTAYSWISFANEREGIIAGWSSPPRRSGQQRLPEWMDPEEAQGRRDWPNLAILLDTRDGGAHWKPSVTSMFGRVSRIRLAPDGHGLGVVEFSNTFEWPSEVFRLDWRTGKSTRVFRRKDRAVTDAALAPGGRAYLAAIEPQGLEIRLPVPGKLKLLRSDDFVQWQEMEVDYRAYGRRAILAAADAAHIWVATDAGMILKLAAE